MTIRDFTDLPRADFRWRALWVWISDRTEAAYIDRMVDTAVEAGFDAIIVSARLGAEGAGDPFGHAVEAAHARGLEVYAWISYLAGAKDAPPQTLQVLLPGQEDAAAAGTRTDPDRVDVMGGPWRCPDRGLSEEEARRTETIVRRYDVDGVAIDFLGYRNYAACWCDHSNALRAAYAKDHPALSEAEVLREVSRRSLAAFSRQVRRRVLAIRPQAKIAVHVYPDFDPDPLYGSLLDVDYCGQTIAWFFTPHWSYGTIRDRHLAFLAAQGRGPRHNRHVPFVGARPGAEAKSPDRVRTEIRLAGLGGCRTFMFAFYETLLEQPELIAVLRDELRSPDGPR